VPAIATDDPARGGGASGAYYPLDYHEVAVVVDDMQRQLKMPIDKSTDVVSSLMCTAHTHQTLFFLPAYLLPRRWLFSLQNKPKMSGEKEREKFSERRREGR
jgi:hypothetical protein